MVSSEVAQFLREVFRAIAELRDEDEKTAGRLRVVITFAGDPLPWADTIRSLGVKMIYRRLWR